MTKLKTPLLSLGAHGTIADQVTYQERQGSSFSRRKPTPTDRRTIRQAYHRWDYQWYAYQWSIMSSAEKAPYFTTGRQNRIPAFAAFIKTMLTTLPDLAGRWHLDCLSPNQAFDTSKNAITGTIVNATPSDGVIHKALYFNGVDAYVNLGTPASLGALINAFTIAMFINPLNLDTYRDYFWKIRWTGAADNGGFILRTIDLKRLTGIVYINGAKAVHSPADTLTYGWQHIAMTYDDPTLTIYRNAIQVFTHDWPGPIPNHDAGTAYIASMSNYPKGDIDEVCVFNYALTPQELTILAERSYPL